MSKFQGPKYQDAFSSVQFSNIFQGGRPTDPPRNDGLWPIIWLLQTHSCLLFKKLQLLKTLKKTLPKIIKIFQTEFQKLKLTIPLTIVSNMNFMKYFTGLHNMRPAITTRKTRHVPVININLSDLYKYISIIQFIQQPRMKKSQHVTT